MKKFSTSEVKVPSETKVFVPKNVNGKTITVDGIKYLVEVDTTSDAVYVTPKIKNLVCEKMYVNPHDVPLGSMLYRSAREKRPSLRKLRSILKDVEPWSIMLIGNDRYLFLGDLTIIPIEGETAPSGVNQLTNQPVTEWGPITYQDLYEVLEYDYEWDDVDITILSIEDLGEPIPLWNNWVSLLVYYEYDRNKMPRIKYGNGIELEYVGVNTNVPVSLEGVEWYQQIFKVYYKGKANAAYKMLDHDTLINYPELEKLRTQKVKIQCNNGARDTFHLTQLNGKPAVTTIINDTIYALYHGTTSFVELQEEDSDRGIPCICDYDLSKFML